jgi:hypothetical protein
MSGPPTCHAHRPQIRAPQHGTGAEHTVAGSPGAMPCRRHVSTGLSTVSSAISTAVPSRSNCGGGRQRTAVQVDWAVQAVQCQHNQAGGELQVAGRDADSDACFKTQQQAHQRTISPAPGTGTVGTGGSGGPGAGRWAAEAPGFHPGRLSRLPSPQRSRWQSCLAS